MRWGLVLALGIASCRGESRPPVQEHASAASGGTTTPTPSPSPASPADAPQASATVDLLHVTSATVVVSSVVANPAISPFDLVDGDLTTAWNARTGDDHAWIAFRVPKTARVDTIRMTVGFTTKGPEGDYFTMNMRIDKVRIYHDGAVMRDVDLDPNNRGLQDIAIHDAGGEYKIEVLHTLPGTKSTWREICISELQVIGPPPPTRGDDLTMKVGSFDSKPLVDDALSLKVLPSFATLDAFCAEFKSSQGGAMPEPEGDCRALPPHAGPCALRV